MKISTALFLYWLVAWAERLLLFFLVVSLPVCVAADISDELAWRCWIMLAIFSLIADVFRVGLHDNLVRKFHSINDLNPKNP